MNGNETHARLVDISKRAKKLIGEFNVEVEKNSRLFSKKEAKAFLKCSDYRVMMRYFEAANIDPTRFKEALGYEWVATLEEIYVVRDIMQPSSILKRKYPKKFSRNENQKCQKIVVQNQKGGVGKTLTALTLATALAAENHNEFKILLIDMDGQCTLSSYYPSDEQCISIGSLIKLPPEKLTKEEGIVLKAVSDTTIPNLKIIPAEQSDRDIETIFHKQFLNGTMKDPYCQLQKIISCVEDDFDIIFIDTPPSLGFAAINAYYAASSVIVPLGANHNDLDATLNYLAYLPDLYDDLNRLGHQGYDFFKFMITNFEAHATSQISVRSIIGQTFGDSMYISPFAKSEAVRRCALEKKSIYEVSKSEVEFGSTLENFKNEMAPLIKEVTIDILRVWDIQELF